MSKTAVTILFTIALVGGLLPLEPSWTAWGKSSGQDPPSYDSSALAKKLSSRSSVARREAAEDLARSASSEYRRLLEGYRVQEKDSRVKLAMDWALYRMGKKEALFPVVDALDSKHAEHAVQYLNTIEGPEPLYIFLKRVNGKTVIRLLEVLARVGDAGTMDQIKPFTESLDPAIADAAKFAEREIGIRLTEPPATEPKRPRRTGVASDTEPH
jgi:hypothetical protein